VGEKSEAALAADEEVQKRFPALKVRLSQAELDIRVRVWVRDIIG